MASVKTDHSARAPHAPSTTNWRGAHRGKSKLFPREIEQHEKLLLVLYTTDVN